MEIWERVVTVAVVIAIGTVLLMLPVASAAGTWTRPLDALFTATSAVSNGTATW